MDGQLLDRRAFFIGGGWVEPAAAERFGVVSPSTEEVVGHVPLAETADVDRAVAAARRAFDEGPWPRTPPAERAEVLRRAAALLRDRTDDIAFVTATEMGCAISQAPQAQTGMVGRVGPSSQWLDMPLRHHQHDPQAGDTEASTRSPTAARRTSAPTASTTPHPSWPGTIGSGRFDSPWTTVRSVWQMPLAARRTSTSCGPMAGVGRSSTTRGLPTS